MVAAWPPVALGLSYELLLTLIRQSATVHEPVHLHLVDDVEPVHEQIPTVVRERPSPTRKVGHKRLRKLLDDYVAEAREHLGPGVNITAAWVREVTDCSRGLSPKIAATLKEGMQ
jgi:hypothetical protein